MFRTGYLIVDTTSKNNQRYLTHLDIWCFTSTFFNDNRTPARINAVKVLVKNIPDFSASRKRFLTFDLNINLNTLLNWSVKQLFLYLTAEYQTEQNELNQIPLGKEQQRAYFGFPDQ
ncbi:signal peptidase complex subunit 3-like [Uranotaenia lowii]|uniref:signal peptidase complex subunit 3-like n=1 Tax=Uranotaenia lowii TaxID=190385 RepID=UPI00247992FB|nr:signal peptidase complex subunit 3-like [Uranotaenia lowii]